MRIIDQNLASLLTKISIVFAAALDIVPLLAAFLLLVFIALVSTTLFTLPMSLILDVIGIKSGLLPREFLIDLGWANFSYLPKSLVTLSPVLLISVRQAFLSPPSSKGELLFAIAASVLGIFVLNSFAAEGKHLWSILIGNRAVSDPLTLNDTIQRFLAIDYPNNFSAGYFVLTSTLWYTLALSTIAIIPVTIVTIIFLIHGTLRLKSTSHTDKIPLRTRSFAISQRTSVSGFVKVCARLLFPLSLLSLIFISDRFFSEYGLAKFTMFLIQDVEPMQMSNLFGFLLAIQANIISATFLVPIALGVVSLSYLRPAVFCMIGFGILSYYAALYFSYSGTIPTSAALIVVFTISFIIAPPVLVIRFTLLETLRFLKQTQIEASKIHHANHRKILLLRPFSIDDTRVRTRQSLVNRILPLTNRNITLEEIIASAAYRLAPLLAVGKPGEKKPPLGAIREYLDDDSWQPFVEEEIEKAARIVFIAGAASFTKWETDQILSSRAIHKLVIVIPPDGKTAVAYFGENPKLVSALSMMPEDIAKIEKGLVQCVYFSKGSCVMIFNRGKTTLDYRISLQHSLYS